MKNIVIMIAKALFILLGIAGISSCDYREVVNAEYPDQQIYMPSAVNGYFIIDNVPAIPLAVPTPGQPYRFIVDLTNNKFTIPLGVYRSGINNNGNFMVDISVDYDTIISLIAAGELANTILLSPDKYSIVSSVEMKDGAEVANFDLSINLDSLRKNYPNKIFALGVGISSTQRKTNPALATTIVVINTKMMKPTANFTFATDANDIKKINFMNTSVYAINYSWNFGDGTDSSALVKPSHTYTTAGTYTVSLTATGPTGEMDKSIISKIITIPEK